MSTFYPKKNNLVDKATIYIDAAGCILGRLSSEVSSKLMGKHKPITTPGFNVGDRVVVVNAANIKVTGKKMTDKIYYKHTGYIGNLKSASLEEKMNKNPADVIMHAVKGMLSKGPLGRTQLKMLRVFNDDPRNGVAK